MFATKPQLASALLERAGCLGIRAAFVAGDEVYGGKFSGRPLPMLVTGGRLEMGSCCRRRSDGLPL
jgi:hypothetical protein